MKLLKLVLSNFKGIKTFELHLDGKSIAIHGDNGTGKTTLADAQCWLLFGNDSIGTKNFTPKPKMDGEDVHGVETGVEGTYLLDDGRTLALKKTFSEVWKKKRGAAAEVFSGHTKNHYIDSVPVKENEYTDRIAEIAAPEILMSLCSVSYFSDVLSTDKRRKILLEITGDVSDTDVIASAPELDGLCEMLAKPDGTSYTVDELLKITKARLTEINNRLKIIPARIDEAQRASLEETDTSAIDNKIQQLTAEKDELYSRMHSGLNAQLSETQTQLAAAQIELLDAESVYKAQCLEANKGTEQRLKTLRVQRSITITTEMHAGENTARMEIKLEQMKKRRFELVELYKEAAAAQWSGDTVCRTCGQPIPHEYLKEAKASFNLSKSKRLEELNNEGKTTCSASMIAELEAKIEAERMTARQERERLQKIGIEIEELEEILAETPTFSSTDTYRALAAKRETISARMKRIQQDGNAMQNALQIQIDEIDKKIGIALDQKAAGALAAAQKKRISELELEQRRLGAEYEKCTASIYLCEAFIRTKVSLLTDRINEKFSNVKFKLFETQINGGVKEVCETLVPSSTGLIPYSYANHAAKINAGLDIIRVLSGHYGVKMPVFVDNAESIVDLNDSELQVIRLVVSESDKKLRVEESK